MFKRVNIARLSSSCYRKYSTEKFTKTGAPFGFNTKPDVNEIKHDYIGPPDEQSNLRPILRHIPENETNSQKILRTERLEVEKWNQEFWTNHNKRFYDEKAEFIAANTVNENETLSADKMSEFYKSFLDKNWRMHFYYNISWYIKNFTLLYLATRVNVASIFRRKK